MSGVGVGATKAAAGTVNTAPLFCREAAAFDIAIEDSGGEPGQDTV